MIPDKEMLEYIDQGLQLNQLPKNYYTLKDPAKRAIIKNQAERERDEANEKLTKTSHELRRALKRIFAQSEIIKFQIKIIRKLSDKIKKLKGD